MKMKTIHLLLVLILASTLTVKAFTTDGRDIRNQKIVKDDKNISGKNNKNSDEAGVKQNIIQNKIIQKTVKKEDVKLSNDNQKVIKKEENNKNSNLKNKETNNTNENNKPAKKNVIMNKKVKIMPKQKKSTEKGIKERTINSSLIIQMEKDNSSEPKNKQTKPENKYESPIIKNKTNHKQQDLETDSWAYSSHDILVCPNGGIIDAFGWCIFEDSNHNLFKERPVFPENKVYTTPQFKN